jgi:hypothetical protein
MTMALTSKEAAQYCEGCMFYKGFMARKQRCYFRVWTAAEVNTPPFQSLRNTEHCEHRRVVKGKKHARA